MSFTAEYESDLSAYCVKLSMNSASNSSNHTVQKSKFSFRTVTNCVYKKGVLRISMYSKGNACVGVSF